MSETAQCGRSSDAEGLRILEELFSTVYSQICDLARHRLKNDRAGKSWETIDLVHEVYLRLVGSKQNWNGQAYFLAAAAEAMRRILVDRARSKARIKHGGAWNRVHLVDYVTYPAPTPEEIVVVSDLLDSLNAEHPLEAQIVKLHYFAGLSISEAGRVHGLSSSAAHRHWSFARAWLYESARNIDEEYSSRCFGIHADG